MIYQLLDRDQEIHLVTDDTDQEIHLVTDNRNEHAVRFPHCNSDHCILTVTKHRKFMEPFVTVDVSNEKDNFTLINLRIYDKVPTVIYDCAS